MCLCNCVFLSTTRKVSAIEKVIEKNREMMELSEWVVCFLFFALQRDGKNSQNCVNNHKLKS